MTDYGDLAPYYDLDRFVDYKAEAEAIHDAFHDYGVHTVLDVACGTGTHLLELASFGYRCVGVDMSPEMLAVAREKAQARNLAVEFAISDMFDYALERTFDAVMGMYIFPLVSDEDFCRGLASVRQAVREGGIFYFNMLNADFKDAGPFDVMAPAFYLDLVVNEPHIRLVRFNQTSFANDMQNWTAIYLIDEGDGVKMIPWNACFRYRRLGWVERELSRVGFRVRSVTYSDSIGLEQHNMFVLAQAEES
jgi:SAM-dependent methyltransferase